MCCRVVSQVTTQDNRPVQLGGVTVVPEPSGTRSMAAMITHEIPAAPEVLSSDVLLSYDRPHSPLIAHDRVSDPDPYGRFQKAAAPMSEVECTTSWDSAVTGRDAAIVGCAPADPLSALSRALAGDGRLVESEEVSDEAAN